MHRPPSTLPQPNARPSLSSQYAGSLRSSASHARKTVTAAAECSPTFSTLLSRRSVVKYDKSKEVPAEVTARALEAAILAPNHFLTEPWRFYSCGPETKAKLAGLNEEKRKMAEGVPEMMVVTLASEHDLSEKLGLEDH